MRQISFCLQKLSEFDTWFQSFQKNRPKKARTVFLSVFVGWSDAEDSEELIRRLADALPDVTIVGCSTAGEIMSGRMSEQTAILNFMFFDKTDVRVFTFDFSETPPEDAAASLTKDLRGLEVAGVGLMAAENDENSHRFLTALRPMAPEAKVFGVIAGIPEGSAPYIWIRDRIVRHGVTAFCFLGSKLRIHLNNGIGWSALGPVFRITKMDGDIVLKELDDRPASYVYKKYLALSPKNLGEEEGLLFPLCLERNGQQTCACPPHVWTTALSSSAETAAKENSSGWLTAIPASSSARFIGSILTLRRSSRKQSFCSAAFLAGFFCRRTRTMSCSLFRQWRRMRDAMAMGRFAGTPTAACRY